MGVSERVFNLAVGAVTVSKKQGLLAVHPVRGPRAVPGQDCAWRAVVQMLGSLLGGHVPAEGRAQPRGSKKAHRSSGPKLPEGDHRRPEAQVV